MHRAERPLRASSDEGHRWPRLRYFLNDKSKLTIGQVDSGTFQSYTYEVDAGILRVSSRGESSELELEWVFQRE